MSLGPAEVLVILVIALLVFGPQRLPEIGRQVGRGMREIRKFQQSLRSDLDDVLADDESNHVEAPPTLPPISEQTPAALRGDISAEATEGAPAPSERPTPPDPT